MIPSFLLPLLSPRRWMLLLLIASVLALGGALLSQYGFGLAPCDLCIDQRYPYLGVIAICAVGWWRGHLRKAQLAALLLSFFLLTLDAGIAWYHTGVEKGVFKGPDACSGQDTGKELTLEELRRQIQEAPLVPCNQAQLDWHGITLAGLNALFATALAAGTLLVLLRMRRGDV